MTTSPCADTPQHDADQMLAEMRSMRQAWIAPMQTSFAYYCVKAREIWPPFRQPTLNFNVSGNCAGKAYYTPNEVRLNPHFCQTETEDMANSTVPHEVAHILAFQRYGSTGHQGAWYAMYGALTGRAPTRLHDYELPQRRQK